MSTSRNRLRAYAGAFALLLLSPVYAAAFEELPFFCDGPGRPRWAANPEYVLDARPFETAAELMDFFAAVSDVFGGLSGVEGTTAGASIGNPNFTLDPTMAPQDLVGTGEGDLTNDVMIGLLIPGAVGFGPLVWDAGTCEILAADIVLTSQQPGWFDSGPFRFEWGTPASAGEPYWDAHQCVGGVSQLHDDCLDYGRFARPVLLHEVLHNLGLAHLPDDYGYMNYGVHPWQNAPESDRVAPLGDDRQALRSFYPAATARPDVAVLNTWFVPSGDVETPGEQFRLCKPSPGDRWNGRFDLKCARPHPWNLVPSFEHADGPFDDEYEIPEICPGDSVRVRYATTNLGTTDMSFDEELWFSIDEQFSGDDLASPDSFGRSLDGGDSRDSREIYASPESLPYDTEFFVIAHLEPDGADDAEQNNAIPLRGKIRTKSNFTCNFSDIELRPF